VDVPKGTSVLSCPTDKWKLCQECTTVATENAGPCSVCKSPMIRSANHRDGKCTMIKDPCKDCQCMDTNKPKGECKGWNHPLTLGKCPCRPCSSCKMKALCGGVADAKRAMPWDGAQASLFWENCLDGAKCTTAPYERLLTNPVLKAEWEEAHKKNKITLVAQYKCPNKLTECSKCDVMKGREVGSKCPKGKTQSSEHVWALVKEAEKVICCGRELLEKYESYQRIGCDKCLTEIPRHSKAFHCSGSNCEYVECMECIEKRDSQEGFEERRRRLVEPHGIVQAAYYFFIALGVSVMCLLAITIYIIYDQRHRSPRTVSPATENRHFTYRHLARPATLRTVTMSSVTDAGIES